MKILLLGANGQVGFAAQRALAPLGPLAAATRSGVLPGGAPCERVDVEELRGLRGCLDRVQPDVIVNAAAYTAVDRAEDEPGSAMRINGDVPGVLGEWAAANEARVLHYSSDYVFDGDADAPYAEDHATAPLGVYGRSKLAGEQALAASGARYLMLRTAWVYAARGRNFLIAMLRLAQERDRLRIVDDQRGAPTPAGMIAAATAALLIRWTTPGENDAAEVDGIYHLACAGECSWHEFACAIFERARVAGLVERVPQVQAISREEYPTRARRPAWSVLDTGRLRERFGLELPPWQDALDSVMGELAEARASHSHL